MREDLKKLTSEWLKHTKAVEDFTNDQLADLLFYPIAVYINEFDSINYWRYGQSQMDQKFYHFRDQIRNELKERLDECFKQVE